MGDGYGPMIVAPSRDGLPERAADDEIRAWLPARQIAVPGTMTSAFLALRLFMGDFDASPVPFDQIFDHVTSGRSQTRPHHPRGPLTYAAEGFVKILDLGDWWKRNDRPAAAAGRQRHPQGHPAAASAR